jgi:hypothetical protein
MSKVDTIVFWSLASFCVVLTGWLLVRTAIIGMRRLAKFFPEQTCDKRAKKLALVLLLTPLACCAVYLMLVRPDILSALYARVRMLPDSYRSWMVLFVWLFAIYTSLQALRGIRSGRHQDSLSETHRGGADAA